jgi:ABC-type nitrate/sulfonate/bicarbonate transport system permease component
MELTMTKRRFIASYSFKKWALRLISLVLIAVIWQWQGSKADSFILPAFTQVISELWKAILSGELLMAAGGTLLTILVGYSIAVVVGIILGIGVALSDWMRNTLEPLIIALYAAPVSIFIPIIILYLGLGFQARVFLIVLWTIFVIIVNTATGIRQTPPSLIEMGQAFNTSRFRLLRTIVLPSALPYILLGLRFGLGRALRGAITAELLLSIANLGRFVSRAGALFNIPRLLAGVLFITLLGVIMLRLMEYLEAYILRYRK